MLYRTPDISAEDKEKYDAFKAIVEELGSAVVEYLINEGGLYVDEDPDSVPQTTIAVDLDMQSFDFSTHGKGPFHLSYGGVINLLAEFGQSHLPEAG